MGTKLHASCPFCYGAVRGRFVRARFAAVTTPWERIPPTGLVGFKHVVVEAQSPRLLYSAILGIVAMILATPTGLRQCSTSKAIHWVGLPWQA